MAEQAGAGRRPGRRPGRPARISRDRIVAAVSSAENLDTLTMRELAARLEVSHAALYRWVRTRDELFDLVGEVLVDRVLDPSTGGAADPDPPAAESSRALLHRIGWAMHDQFLALPGYATHLSRPHRHHPHSVDRIRTAIVESFVGDGVERDMAEHSWHIFVTSTVSWLAAAENPLELGGLTPRFDLFLEVLVRGLPARTPADQSP